MELSKHVAQYDPRSGLPYYNLTSHHEEGFPYSPPKAALSIYFIYSFFSFQESLLSTLLSVVENSKEQPHYSVTFPCKRTQEVSPKSGFVHSTLKKKSQISRTDSKGEIL